MARLDPNISEFATTEEAEAYDAWFRAKVEKSLADTRPPISHDDAMAHVKAIIDRKRKTAG